MNEMRRDRFLAGEEDLRDGVDRGLEAVVVVIEVDAVVDEVVEGEMGGEDKVEGEDGGEDRVFCVFGEVEEEELLVAVGPCIWFIDDTNESLRFATEQTMSLLSQSMTTATFEMQSQGLTACCIIYERFLGNSKSMPVAMASRCE